MKLNRILIPLFLLCGLAIPVALAAPGDVTTTLSGVHLCCGSCVTGAKNTVAGVKGAAAVVDQTGGTIAITAADKDTVQKTVDALTTAGFFGKSSNADIKVNADTGAPEGKVKTIEVTNLHLCCAKCVTAVNDVLSKEDGVTGNTAKAKATSFTVSGDFDAKKLAADFQKAGLTGKMAAPK